MRGLCTIVALIVVIGGAVSVLPGGPNGPLNGADLLGQHSPCNPSIQVCL
jgi:hypothetical protein